MKPAEILRAARAKIEQGWCQRCVARDSQGYRIYVGNMMEASRNPAAVSWCAQGAVFAAGGDINGPELPILGQAVGSCIGIWNDRPRRTKEEVLAAFDRAIELAEANR